MKTPLCDGSVQLRPTGQSWTARGVDVDALDVGVLFGDDSRARQAHAYFKTQLRAEDRWKFTELDVGGDGYCASYDDGFAQFSCAWTRENLVLSTTMVADDSGGFDPQDVRGHAAALDVQAKER